MDEQATVQISTSIPAEWNSVIDEMMLRRGLMKRSELIRSALHDAIIAHQDGGKSGMLVTAAQERAVLHALLLELKEGQQEQAKREDRQIELLEIIIANMQTADGGA